MSAEDVIDAQDARLEVYIRMNDDNEKDYCFSVGINDTFSTLIDIFTTLKLSLRPSAFYDQIPIGFTVSNDPGYLTLYGGLLFTDKASKNVKSVKLNDKISDHVWPGQLILPVWKPKTFNKYATLTLLAAWLYTDLPDVWSPTPGISLTNQITKLIAWALIQFDLTLAAADLLGETVVNKASFTAQMIYFGFHVLKALMIYFTLWIGLFNPYSLNPYTVYKVNKTDKFDDSKREQLLEIGWTGSRRATIDEFRDHFRETEVARVGGIVKASKLGLFETFREPGVTLGPGEGFQTELTNVKSLKEVVESPANFLLTFDYYAEIGEFFETYLSTQSKNINQDIKNFRKFGPSDNSNKIKDLAKARREISKEQEKSAEDKKKQ